MRKGVSKVKSLQRKAESLWKQIAIKRDGKSCQVQKHFPYLNITHTEIYQVDHCFTRKNKHLFLEPRNSTVVCSACNLAKSMDLKSVDDAIKQIVLQREGELHYKRMLHNNMTHKANTDWGKVWWLQEQIAKLETKLKEIDNG